MISRSPILFFLIACFASLVVNGCKPSDETAKFQGEVQGKKEEIEGLKNRIEAKEKANRDLKVELDRLHRELAAVSDKTQVERKGQIEEIVKAHQSELLTVRELARERLAAVQESLEEQSAKYLQANQERLVLGKLVDQPSRLAPIYQANRMGDRFILIGVAAIFALVSGVFAMKYFQARDKLRGQVVNFIAREATGR